MFEMRPIEGVVAIAMRLEVREAFPMTPSGKIQKYQLREEIARLLGQTPLIR